MAARLRIGVRFALLGPFRAYLSSGETLELRSLKAQALVSYLACRHGAAATRDKLRSLLWGQSGEAQAQHSLRQALLSLRRALGPDAVCLGVDARQLRLDASRVGVDVWDFERLSQSHAVADLQRAAALYRGDFLDGVAVREEAFDAWSLAERERLRELAVRLHARLLPILAARGRAESAIQAALALLALEPSDSRTRRTLMRLYEREGRLGAAVRHYEEHARQLERELRVGPDPETTRLYRDILARGRDSADDGRGVRWRAAAGTSSTRAASASPFLLLVDHDPKLLGRLLDLLRRASRGRPSFGGRAAKLARP